MIATLATLKKFLKIHFISLIFKLIFFPFLDFRKNCDFFLKNNFTLKKLQYCQLFQKTNSKTAKNLPPKIVIGWNLSSQSYLQWVMVVLIY